MKSLLTLFYENWYWVVWCLMCVRLGLFLADLSLDKRKEKEIKSLPTFDFDKKEGVENFLQEITKRIEKMPYGFKFYLGINLQDTKISKEEIETFVNKHVNEKLHRSDIIIKIKEIN